MNRIDIFKKSDVEAIGYDTSSVFDLKEEKNVVKYIKKKSPDNLIFFDQEIKGEVKVELWNSKISKTHKGSSYDVIMEQAEKSGIKHINIITDGLGMLPSRKAENLHITWIILNEHIAKSRLLELSSFGKVENFSKNLKRSDFLQRFWKMVSRKENIFI